jgi:hypothetical protein
MTPPKHHSSALRSSTITRPPGPATEPIRPATAGTVKPGARPHRSRLLKEREKIRPEKVARARELIADPAYPPRQVLKAIAERLVSERAASGPNRRRNS